MFENNLQFFSSGSTLLDLALGGGWALGRVFNIVGDRSTGKTLLAIEALANFDIQIKGRMRYAEAEAAFDDVFAEQLGFPESVERPDDLIHTAEEFTRDYYRFIQDCKESNKPGLYILDSLDALSDEAEIVKFEKSLAPKKEDDEEQKGSYGVAKPKEMSKMFRLLCQEAEGNNCSLGIISQIRDNIGVRFGETKTRSGGKALDFYASQVLWLAEKEKLMAQALNQKRVTGVSIRSRVKKNKAGLPFREADYDIIFGYGIDDENSLLDYLYINKQLAKEAYHDIGRQVKKAREDQNYEALAEIRDILKADTMRIWREVEEKLMPKIRKYNQTPLSETSPKDVSA